MSRSLDLQGVVRRKTVKLTTLGRRSGEQRSVTVWFVVSGEHSIQVQHVASKPAQWYRNLCANPEVEVDFGNGPLSACAVPIADAGGVRQVLSRVGKKYWTYRVIRLFGGDSSAAVAAEITLAE